MQDNTHSNSMNANGSESNGFSQGFSQKLLDVPLETLSVAAVYDPIEL